MPSLFLNRNSSLKNFSSNAPSVLHSQRDHEYYVKNAMNYNSGTLTPINSDFLSGLLKKDASIQNDMSFIKRGKVDSKDYHKN